MATDNLPTWAICQTCGDRYAAAYLALCCRCGTRVCPACRRLLTDGRRVCVAPACARKGATDAAD